MPFGAKTRTYRSVTKDSQFWQLGIYLTLPERGA